MRAPVNSMSPWSTCILSFGPGYHSPHWGQNRFSKHDLTHVISWLKIHRWLSITLRVNATSLYLGGEDQNIWLLPMTLNLSHTTFLFNHCAMATLGFLILNMIRSCTAKGQRRNPPSHYPIIFSDFLPRLNTYWKFIIWCPISSTWAKFWEWECSYLS